MRETRTPGSDKKKWSLPLRTGSPLSIFTGFSKITGADGEGFSTGAFKTTPGEEERVAKAQETPGEDIEESSSLTKNTSWSILCSDRFKDSSCSSSRRLSGNWRSLCLLCELLNHAAIKMWEKLDSKFCRSSYIFHHFAHILILLFRKYALLSQVIFVMALFGFSWFMHFCRDLLSLRFTHFLPLFWAENCI